MIDIILLKFDHSIFRNETVFKSKLFVLIQSLWQQSENCENCENYLLLAFLFSAMRDSMYLPVIMVGMAKRDRNFRVWNMLRNNQKATKSVKIPETQTKKYMQLDKERCTR